jgi:hypothetical protein
MSFEAIHLAAAVGVAFADVVPPTKDQVLHPSYTNSEDALELRETFGARHWLELESSELFRHREMLVALSGEAYRAFVAAYLVAALGDDESTAGDFRHYLVTSLGPIGASNERLSRLDATQRNVIADVLRYLAESRSMRLAAEQLAVWK